MWYKTFDQRLHSWADLRHRAQHLSTQSALIEINNWWAKSPWVPYYLHWDDQTFWPDPWQLLDDNIFCNLARGLGIVYTILLLNRDDFKNLVLFEFEYDNLVMVGHEKYILNSTQEIFVNSNPEISKVKKSISGLEIKQKFNLG
jgi:hypothetical protein